jgi:hypothetical protein
MTMTASRRAIVAGVAILPAIAALPAVAATIPTDADAELLELGRQLEPFERAWWAQTTIERKSFAALSAKIEQATGVAFDDAPMCPMEEDTTGYWETRIKLINEKHKGGQTSDDFWDRLHADMWPALDEIFARQATTTAGLAVQARALVMATSDFCDCDNEQIAFFESVCAVIGIEPRPV